jgi:putative addiction module CopG family antidote
MTIHLPEHREEFVRSLVRGGEYASESEVIDEALRLLEQRSRGGAGDATMTPDELNRRLLADGLMSRLPDPADDIDDEADDELTSIEGEPLSETIVRERR